MCGAIEKYLRTRQEGHDLSIDEDRVQLIAEVAQKVNFMLDGIKAGSMPDHEKALLDRVNKAIQSELQQQLQLSSSGGRDRADLESQAETEPEPDTGTLADNSQDDFELAVEDLAEDDSVPAVEEEQEIDIEEDQDFAVEEGQVEIPQAAEESGQATADISYNDIDGDLIDIFIEEADELIESCEEILQKITNNPEDADSIHQLQRYMHTLKGGARMAELTPVGDLTHLLESLVIKVSEKQVRIDRLLFNTLNDSVDRLAVMLKSVKDRAPIDTAGDLVVQLEALIKGEVHEKRSVERYDIELDDLNKKVSAEEVENGQSQQGSQDKPTPAGPNLGRRATDKEEKPQWGERATDVNYRDTQEQIRVRADLLNELVNSAGEVNIHHARMSKQMSEIGFNIS